jgi:hypothetical protein
MAVLDKHVGTSGAMTLLTVEQILVWADAHRTRTGRWPHQRSGAVAGVPGQSWSGADEALRSGRRGLPGGDTLAQLLNRHRRGGRNGRPGPVRRYWTAEEDAMVQNLPAKAVARRTGCSLTVVYRRRHQLGLGRPCVSPGGHPGWSQPILGL